MCHLWIGKIPNQNSSSILRQQFLICQRQQRITRISERTRCSYKWNFGIFWCQCPIHQHFSTNSPWSYKQEIDRTNKPKRSWTFSGQFFLHTQSYPSFGTSTQPLCLILPGKILQTTPGSHSRFSYISSYYQHLYGILTRTSPRPWMPHTYPMVEKIYGCHYQHS